MTIQSLLGDAPDDRPALIGHDDAVVSYGELRGRVAALGAELGGELVFLRGDLTVESILLYVACVELHAPVLLLDRDLEPELLARLTETYDPGLVLGFDVPPPGYDAVDLEGTPVTAAHRRGDSARTHPDLAVLLSTSGSTGNPKLVRLSRAAIISNADAIVRGLGIRESDRSVTCLPYSYTYGLSIINSHLRAGATTVVTDSAITTGEFWRVVDQFGVTALAGVPTTYRMLRQMRWSVESHPSVRYATQAGGRLADADRVHFRDMFDQADAIFYVMYGQTEATARITITAPTDLFESISTAGRPIEGGAIEIRSEDADGAGEVWYIGPNVMLGYAENVADLARGDDQNGTLATGDLGFLKDGKLFLTGRSKRIVKIFGKRVSLDDVDQWLQRSVDGVSVQGNDAVVLFVKGEVPSTLRAELAGYLHVHPSGVKAISLETIPLLSSGKVDYQTLNGWALQ
jgi:acyl-CoA synthetase (AMP-forming)/AMP-acid ligase II